MWSKRPKPGGKGLRCRIEVARPTGIEPCERPARRYGQQLKAFWQNNQLLDAGTIDCCKNHAAKLERQGVILTLIDRRKRTGIRSDGPTGGEMSEDRDWIRRVVKEVNRAFNELPAWKRSAAEQFLKNSPDRQEER